MFLWYSILLSPADVVGLAGQGRGNVFGRIAEDEVVDALVVAFDAEFLENLLAFGAVELLLGAVNPAGSQADGMGGIGEVGEHRAAVVEVGGYRTVGKDDENNWGAIEGVEAVGGCLLATLAFQVVPDGGVHLRQAVAQLGVGDGNDEGALFAVARRCPGSGFAYGGNEFTFRHT